jgi:hypothetical protein
MGPTSRSLTKRRQVGAGKIEMPRVAIRTDIIWSAVAERSGDTALVAT